MSQSQTLPIASSIQLNEQEVELYKQVQATGIKIGVLVDPPYAYDCYDSTEDVGCPQVGLGIELTRAICNILAISCTFVKQNHSKYGDNLSGEWQGMIRQIMDGEYDTSMPAFNPTVERIKVVDFSFPVYDESNMLITRFPKVEAFSAGSVIFAFSWQVWLSILASLFTLGAVSAILHEDFQRRGRRSVKRFCTLCLEKTLGALSIFVAQEPGGSETHYRVGSYIILGTWGLACIVLASAYSSQIVALALDVQVQLPFQNIPTLARCIQNRECVIVARSLSASYFERIFNAKDGPLAELNRALKQVPPLISDPNSNSVGVLDDQDTPGVYRVVYNSISTYASMIQSLPPCSLDAVQSDSYDNTAYPLAMKSPLKLVLNKAILAVREAGLVEKLYAKYVGGYLSGQSRCKKFNVEETPMTVKAFIGSFLLLTSGSLLGIFTLILERFLKYLKTKNMRKS